MCIKVDSFVTEANVHFPTNYNLLFDKCQTVNDLSFEEEALLQHLKYFREMLYKHIDLVDRRLLKEEVIPHEEKIFSIFEPWVEWICGARPTGCGCRSTKSSLI